MTFTPYANHYSEIITGRGRDNFRFHDQIWVSLSLVFGQIWHPPFEFDQIWTPSPKIRQCQYIQYALHVFKKHIFGMY